MNVGLGAGRQAGLSHGVSHEAEGQASTGWEGSHHHLNGTSDHFWKLFGTVGLKDGFVVHKWPLPGVQHGEEVST